ncbi:MAG: hypothetical protein RSD36_16530 [Terrisporobacter sp.]
MKFKYRVYGLNIESELELSELIKLEEDTPNIDVSISYGKVPKEIKDKINETTCVGITKSNMCLYVKDIAIYQVTDGNKITIEYLNDMNIHRIKAYLLGWAFGVLFVQRNTIALHGATIVKNNKAFIIAGRSKSGKSTLSSSLIKKGYKFLSDDVAPVELYENEIIIHPAYPQQKLGRDIMDILGYDVNNYEINRIGSERERYKVPVRDIFIDKALPIKAIIEITVDDNEEVEIEKMEGSEKMDCLLENIYFLNVARNSGMKPEYFKQCLQIAKEIPIYKIKRPDGKFTIKEQIDFIEDILLDA